jgi:hypothetical protein
MAELRERGWTPATIKKHLGSPDETKTNPKFRSGAPMKLYLIERVKSVEASPSWQADAGKAATRVSTAQAAAKVRAEALVEETHALPVTLAELSADELVQLALDHFNARREERARMTEDDLGPATQDSDASFIARITVNYLRHRCSEYETYLDNLSGKPGVRRAQSVVRDRIYSAIASAYPHLADECARQRAVRANG